MIGGKIPKIHSSYNVPPKQHPKFLHQNISTLWSKSDSFDIDMFSLIQVKNSNFHTKMIPLFNKLHHKCNPKEKKYIQLFLQSFKEVDFVPFEMSSDKIVLKKNAYKGGMDDVNNSNNSLVINDDKAVNRQLQHHANEMIQAENNLELQKSKIELMNNIVKLMQDQQDFCSRSEQSNWNRKNMWIVFNLLFSGTIIYTTKNAVNIVISGMTLSTIKFVNTTMGMTGYLVNPLLRFINSTSRIPDGTEIMSKLSDLTNTIKDDPEMQPLLEALHNTGMGMNVLSFIILFIFTCFVSFLIRMCLYADNISFMGFSISTNQNNTNQANPNTMVQMLQNLNFNPVSNKNASQNQLEHKKDKGGYSHKSNKKKYSKKKKHKRKSTHKKKTRSKKK